MKWNELFNINQMPLIEDIRIYIGEAKPNWDELVLHIEETYKPKRQLDYSKDYSYSRWYHADKMADMNSRGYSFNTPYILRSDFLGT